jgi:hypothetical protein
MTFAQLFDLIKRAGGPDWFWHTFILAVQLLNTWTIYFLTKKLSSLRRENSALDGYLETLNAQHRALSHELSVYKHIVDMHSNQIVHMQMGDEKTVPIGSPPIAPEPKRTIPRSSWNRDNLIADTEPTEDMLE